MLICIIFHRDTKISSLFILRLRSLLHLHGIVNNQIHEFIETLGITLVSMRAANLFH